MASTTVAKRTPRNAKKKPSPLSRALVLGTGGLMTLSLFIEPACNGTNGQGNDGFIDAAVTDAPTIDASIDGPTVDAAVDAATIDSSVDAATVDSSVDAAIVDSSVDAPVVDSSIDAPLPPDPVGDFAGMSSTFTKLPGGGNGCGVFSFALVVTPGVSIVAKNFAGNPDTTCTLVQGMTNKCSAMNLSIFQQPMHTCTWTRTSANTLTIDCSNPNGGTCQELMANNVN